LEPREKEGKMAKKQHTTNNQQPTTDNQQPTHEEDYYRGAIKQEASKRTRTRTLHPGV
jgi:hypothetical protein